MINCIAVDDEPLALDLVEDFIKKIPYLNLIKKCFSPYDALEILQTEKIDLIFLDIQMPELSGIQFAKSLSYNPMIIFTTAYSNYAVDGFNLNAIDYLVKPCSFDRFFTATNKAFKIANQQSEQTKVIQKKETTDKTDYFFIKSENSTVRINFKDILYIEGLKDYVIIYSANKKTLSLQTMKNMEQKLPLSMFARVHRSYIIAISKIDSIQRNRIIIGEKWIPIGGSYKDSFNNLINNH